VVSLSTVRGVAYEALRVGKFSVDITSPSGTDTTVPLTISGTATNGVDYVTISNPVVIPAGQTNVPITITPIDNNRIDGNRTVILTLNPGAGYALGSPTNGTVIIKDDDLPPGITNLFSDSFDTDTSANWIVNANRPGDDIITFAYNYSADGIPSAPKTTNGTTLGMKLEANIAGALRSGISASPVGGNFTGDFRIRFDMWINYNGPPLFDGGPESTELLTAGVGTTGTHPQWNSGSNNVDGVWFAVTGDGGVSDDYQAFKGTNELTVSSNPGVYTGGSQNGANVYYSEFGGDPAPQSQQNTFPTFQIGTSGAGNAGFAWHDVVITKQGNTVSWSIDALSIATVSTTNLSLSSNIFVGYFDPLNGISPAFGALSFGIVDNLRVERLSAQPSAPRITTIQIVGGNVQIDFTGSASDSPSSFALQSANVVTGPYTDVVPAATIIQLSPGVFRATKSMSGSMQFYRIRR
ncbi:MAG: Calx-beta domain-containing protein, partial [Limisphaerales bacterium]